VSDALADEAEQMKSGRLVRTLFEVSVEREERREKVVGRCVVAVPGAEVLVKFAFRELYVGLRLLKVHQPISLSGRSAHCVC
jgi:hypothetical protein